MKRSGRDNNALRTQPGLLIKVVRWQWVIGFLAKPKRLKYKVRAQLCLHWVGNCWRFAEQYKHRGWNPLLYPDRDQFRKT